MAQEFLPKDIKTYPEATSLEGINLFGHNVATGAGENLPGSKIQEAIDAAGGMFLVTYNTGAGTADKSYTEIATALQAGKSVVLKSISAGGESFYTHTGSGSSGVEFSLVYEGSNGPIIEELTVNPSNVWSETLHQGASKDYVDNAIEGIGKPLTYKGGATVAQLNAGPSGLDSGWVYTCTTAGTLTAGSVEVEIGDEVAWNGTAWVKIGGEGGKAFVVTYDGTEGDKTQLEIYAAMSAGKVCLLYDSDWKQFAYGGMIGSGNTIYFYTTRPGSEGLTCTEYSVTSSDVWTRRQVSNPGEAPIDNKAYGRWNGTWEEVALKTYVDGLVGNVESLLAAL